VADPAPNLTEPDLRQWKLIADFRARLAAQAKGPPAHPSWQAQQRQLTQSDYLSLLLLGLVNPTIKTLRALSAASQVRRVQE